MRRLIIPMVITALMFTAAPARSSNLGGSIIVTFGRSAQDGNNLINFTISGLEATKGVVQAAENDNFFIEVGVVVLNLQAQDPINVVTNPPPTDSGMEAEEDDEIRKGNTVRLRSQTRLIPTESASIIKDLLDQCIPLGYEVSISLVLVDSAGGRHYLDTTTINGPINYIAAQDDTTCDGLDDDCDDIVDEDYVSVATTCGVGICEGNTGSTSCVNGQIVDSCDPLAGAFAEFCDDLDNDCDGAIDEGCSVASCVDCHSSQQDNGDNLPNGGRRAVALEFPSEDNHAHYGSILNDDACLICHDNSTHSDGYVDLIDADGSINYRFIQPGDLTTDPDLSNFCASCHDENGATRLSNPFDPFGNGSLPPEIATRFNGNLQWREWYGDFCFGSAGTLRFVNSHHDIDDADQALSGAKVECINCHGAHNSSKAQPLADPIDTATAWIGDNNGFCLRCHHGAYPEAPGFPEGVLAPFISVDEFGTPCDAPSSSCGQGFTSVSGLRPLLSCDYRTSPWSSEVPWFHSAHGLGSKRSWPGYSGAPDAIIDCLVCHDPHGSYTQSNTSGNPYIIRDFVDGTGYIDDGVLEGSHWTGPPWETFGTAREVVITVTPGSNPPPGGSDYAILDWGGPTGLCSVCHTNWIEANTFYHSNCNACQFCHGHGQLWGEADYVDQDDSVSCLDCGNGIIEGNEECDDGNSADGDGCSNECKIE